MDRESGMPKTVTHHVFPRLAVRRVINPSYGSNFLCLRPETIQATKGCWALPSKLAPLSPGFSTRQDLEHDEWTLTPIPQEHLRFMS
jgi:hypothetical protein